MPPNVVALVAAVMDRADFAGFDRHLDDRTWAVGLFNGRIVDGERKILWLIAPRLTLALEAVLRLPVTAPPPMPKTARTGT